MNQTNQTQELVTSIIEGIQRKKGKQIASLNLTKLHNAIAKYFIICHGDSNTHVEAIANSVIDTVQNDLKEKAVHQEGFENAIWILLDYVDVVVHVFQNEHREHYNLEGLWADAEIQLIEEEGE